MQADNLGQLLDLETPLENGVREAFDALDLSAYSELNASTVFQKKRPRLEIRARMGSGTGHVYVSQATGKEQEDQWDCTVEVSCIVAPENKEENNSLLPQLAAAVRQYMGQIGDAALYDTDNFPFHCFNDRLQSVGVEYNVEPEHGCSWRKLTFRGTWGIRGNAWPIGF